MAATGMRTRLPASHNALLGSLPAAEYEALVPELEGVRILSGIYVDEFGGPPEHVYFPTHGLVSVVYESEAGECTELALVGNEGMIGVTSFMAGEAPLNHGLVLAPCFAYRLPARRLKAKFLEGGALQRVLLAYAESLMLQISLTAVCNRHHTLEKQLCRWLLQSLDRVVENELRVSQELIASLLGVRRQGVTEAVSSLEKRGVISWARGVITVTDHAGLLAHSCDCYDVLRRETRGPALAEPSPERNRALPPGRT